MKIQRHGSTAWFVVAAFCAVGSIATPRAAGQAPPQAPATSAAPAQTPAQPAPAVAPQGVVVVFQDYSRALLQWRTVAANVALGLEGRLAPAALRERSHAALADGLFVWAGCEFTDFREIRKIVRKEWGLPRDRHLVTAYWRRGVQDANGGGEGDGGEE